MTFGPSFCLHEIGLQYPVTKFHKLFTQLGTEYVGVAEARAVFYFDQFMELFPESKVVVVKRRIQDVASSLRKHGFNFGDVSDVYEKKLKEISALAMVVDYEDIPFIDLWKYCVPDYPVNETRLRMLLRCNIQLTEPEMQRHLIPTGMF